MRMRSWNLERGRTRMGFTAAELAEMARADAEIEATFRLTNEDLALGRQIDREAVLEGMDAQARKRAEYQRQYREAHKDERAEYMRQYHRRKRMEGGATQTICKIDRITDRTDHPVKPHNYLTGRTGRLVELDEGHPLVIGFGGTSLVTSPVADIRQSRRVIRVQTRRTVYWLRRA